MYFSNKYIKLGFLYNIAINLVALSLKCLALFNNKINLGVKGRSKTFSTLEDSLSLTDKTLWFHCASLGEYEQGLPVFKVLREHYKSHKIILSFFSPSGYEVVKKKSIADIVIYLPIDTNKNAKKFLNIIKPELAVFVKYDIWPNFLNELKSRKLRAILISAAFRSDQSYFKFYGVMLRKALFAFEHIFTQNEDSKRLLKSINYNSVTVSGDTRFDRVSNQLKQDNSLEFIDEFKGGELCVVAGSTWPEGENLFVNYINEVSPKNVKFIIAPHNIKGLQIKKIQANLKVKSVLYSERHKNELFDSQVFILDTIGLLSKTYIYADIAYVGGALSSTGLHNTLEPAVFGVPIIIGNIHSKFPEAKAMIDNGGMFSISNQLEFNTVLTKLIEDEHDRMIFGNLNKKYIENNRGAVNEITNYILK